MQTQKRAIILSASAGSGKTYQLAYKYIKDVIARPELYRAILAVTFTNKATEEMKSRILKDIHALASGDKSSYLEQLQTELGYSEEFIRQRAMLARKNILHDYSRFSVLTIDRFYQRIIRAFLKELDIDMDYNIELNPDTLLGRGADALIERIADNEELKKWLLEFAQERLDEGTRWDMRGDLQALGKELFKGRSIDEMKQDRGKLLNKVTEIVQRSDSAKKTIKECAEQCAKIIEQYNLQPSAFKGGSRSFVFALLRYANGELKAPSDTLRKAAKDATAWYVASADATVKGAAQQMQPYAQRLCETYDSNIATINTAKMLKSNYRSYALLADLHEEVVAICNAENTKLLGDTKHLLSGFVNDSNAPFIYEKVGNRYEHYMIDEFQDTATREWNNMLPLLKNAMASNEDTSVLIVGDVKQSIYRWRGGDWRLLKDTAYNDLGKDDTLVDSLKFNYRSLKSVVEFNNKLIAEVVERENEFLNSTIDTALSNNEINQAIHDELKDVIRLAYDGHIQKVGKKSEFTGYAEVCVHNSTTPPFIEVIEDAIARGYRYSDILILARSGRDGRKIADELFRYKREKFTSQGEVGFNILTLDSLTIEGNDITEFIISVLRLCINPANDIERGIYNRYLGYSFDHTFDNDEQSFLRQVSHLSPVEAFESIVTRFHLNERTDCIAYLQAMHEQVIAFSSSRIADIPNYLSWWDDRGHEANLTVEMSDNTIEITTIHKAKGLERPLVIVPYCKWKAISRGKTPSIVWATADNSEKEIAEIGDFPVAFGSSMKESAFKHDYYREYVMSHVDMINMLYVAVTRASQELYLFTPPPPKNPEGISDVYQLVANAAKVVCGEGITTTTSENETKTTYCFGKKLEHHTIDQKKRSKERVKEVILDTYSSFTPETAIYYPRRRYIDEELYKSTAARYKGIKLHSIFERATTLEELYAAIRRLEKGCIVDSVEADNIRRQIEEAMADSRVAEWFSNKWSDVKRESEIIHNGELRRPDRVMIDQKRVIVVDYKFGEVIDKEHTEQVKAYMELMQRMESYDTIEGYVWYVSLGEIVTVKL